MPEHLKLSERVLNSDVLLKAESSSASASNSNANQTATTHTPGKCASSARKLCSVLGRGQSWNIGTSAVCRCSSTTAAQRHPSKVSKSRSEAWLEPGLPTCVVQGPLGSGFFVFWTMYSLVNYGFCQGTGERAAVCIFPFSAAVDLA